MHYVASAYVTTDNDSDNPVVVPVHMASGTLTDVQVVFPPGCVRLVRVQIYHGSTQLLPSELSTYYAEDSMVVPAKVHETFDTGDNYFRVVAWHVGCAYSHRVNVYFDVAGVDEMSTADAILYQTEVLALLAERIRGYY